MKSRYALLCLLAFGIITVSLSSCVKIQNRVLIKGTWELVNYSLDYKTDTTGHNFMEILPGYTQSGDCCRYMIDFKDNGLVTASYYVLDTLNYTVDGTWSLDEKSMLYINLDQYVDGLYEIDRQNRKNYIMTTDSNTLSLGSARFVAPVKMDIKRRF